jgi:hypothetical protein
MDAFIYVGSSQLSTGTLTTCHEADPVGDEDPPTDFQFTSIDIVGVLQGFGAACVHLKSPGGPYLGTPCTGNGPISGSIDVQTFSLGCTVLAGTIDNISIAGDVIDITDPNNPDPATASCGYGSDDLKTIAANAVDVDANAKHLMIICGDATHPDSVDVPCVRNAQFHLVYVLYTTADASECPDSDCQ